MSNCIQCNKEFEAKRADAKFCSNACNQAHLRDVRDNPVRDSVRDNSKPSVPAKTENAKDFNQFKVVGKNWKGGPMYLCGKHREHAKQYCEKMCDDDCVHVLKDRIIGQCRWCGKKITPEIYGNNWNLVECCYSCVAERNKIKRELYPKDNNKD